PGVERTLVLPQACVARTLAVPFPLRLRLVSSLPPVVPTARCAGATLRLLPVAPGGMRAVLEAVPPDVSAVDPAGPLPCADGRWFHAVHPFAGPTAVRHSATAQ